MAAPAGPDRWLDRGRRLCRSRWPLLAGTAGGLFLAAAAIAAALLLQL